MTITTLRHPHLPTQRHRTRPHQRQTAWPPTAVVAVVGLVGLAAWGVYALGEGDSAGQEVGPDLGMPDPQTVDLPPLPNDRVQIVSYMQEGEGRLLREFHSATAGLVELDVVAADAAAGCRSLVEQRLTDIAEQPADLLTVAAAVPDETTAHLIVNDVAAKRDLLASCAAGEVEAALDFRDEVAFTHALVQRRLAEIGIVSQDVP